MAPRSTRACGAAALLAAIFVVSIAVHSADGFKENEFRKCKDTGFCRRHRGIKGPLFAVLPDTVASGGDGLTATLRNEAAGVDLALSLRYYSDGFLRLMVDEDESIGRYKITDLQPPDLEQRVVAFMVEKQDGQEAVLSAGNARVTLSFKPFLLSVAIKGTPAVVLNSRGLFDFEHSREKPQPPADGEDGGAVAAAECDGCWEEKFLSFTDSKPNGPEAISLDVSFPGFKHVYGIPEHASSFVLKPTANTEPYRMYNLDVFEYNLDSTFGLYGSIPLMVAHKPGLTTGVLWLNAAEMLIDVAYESGGAATQWVAEGGVVDVYVFVGPSPADVQRQNAVLTGAMALPQLFSIGYHQCRWNYKDDADVREVNAGFDQYAIPYDVIWLDIEHTNGKRYLTFDNRLFPEPEKLQNDLAVTGRKMVTIVDPHVKRDKSYYIFTEADKENFFVLNADGRVFDGWCWPGSSSYLDVTDAGVRHWWAQQFTLDKYAGSTQHLYIWNDMNEPSVFNGPEITMQKDLRHHGGTVEHRELHNQYGLYYHMATAEGMLVRGRELFGEDGDRPFVLSRAFFVGTQTVGPIWTGDNMAKWEHLEASVPMLLSLSVAGLSFAGADVGGFFGNPDPELLARWYQLGTYYPFFRGHAHLDAPRREPWLFGEETTTRLRDAIRERYALLPYMYTLCREANVSGAPLLRPLWHEFPDDADTFGVDNQLMLGPGLLVAPVVAAGEESKAVRLPRGARWYAAHTGHEAKGPKHNVQLSLESIPVYYRGGAIVPRRERPRRSTATMAADPFTLIVALDARGAASGDLYLDDGRSHAFLRGGYTHRNFTFSGGRLANAAVPTQPGVPPSTGWDGAAGLTIERVVFLGLPPSLAKPGLRARLPGGAELPVEAGPVSLRYGGNAAMVLRKPNLRVDADWSVELVALK